MSTGLGIDAGGTYTDAVLYNVSEGRLIAKAKALTTYHNLLEGIRNALAQLPGELLRDVEVTSLSTTLATNSIVEGRGHKVGLIVLAPWDWFGEEIGHHPWVKISGTISISGDVVEPLDEEACRNAVRTMVEQEGCAAIVVAGYATVRNPEQANRVREIVREVCDVPVICAHEVSRRLNAVHGARAAIANARLLPVIRELIDSVHTALAEFHVPGRLMVVKGDGTPVDESVARERPVETILSGPAASVSGARLLTGLDDALVVDIGGTTTDCAILQDGCVALSLAGARIGSRVMSVDVADICTVGLGGDSRIDFTGDRRITIGPARNIPLAFLAGEYSLVYEFLLNFDSRWCAGASDAAAIDVLVLGGSGRLDVTKMETRLLDLLRNGPVPAIAATEMLDLPSSRLLPTPRLEACGMVKRSSLTPTDLLHVTGEFTRWSVKGAQKALEIFSAMFGCPAEEVIALAQLAVTRRLFEEIVRREVSWENKRLHDLPANWAFLLEKAFGANSAGLEVKFEINRPIVAIGAPAQALVPKVSEHLLVRVVVPEHADVANAIGAIGSEIVARDEILILPGELSGFVLHGTEERVEFAELDEATDEALSISRERALRKAVAAGAVLPEVAVSHCDHLGTMADGSRIFLERRVTAVASGSAFGRK